MEQLGAGQTQDQKSSDGERVEKPQLLSSSPPARRGPSRVLSFAVVLLFVVALALGFTKLLGDGDEIVHSQMMRFAMAGLAAAALAGLLYLALRRLFLKPVTVQGEAMRIPGVALRSLSDGPKRRDPLDDLALALRRKIDEENSRAHSELMMKHEEAQRQAVTDEITGLYNHRYFRESLARELERSIRLNTPLTLLFIDLDNFKELNDNFGHRLGDHVLHEMGEVLKNALRQFDIICRYGGDEFAVVLPATNRQTGETAAERIRSATARHRFGISQGQQHSLTISIGVASCPEDGATTEDLIWMADRAMYYAKQHGRNKVWGYMDRGEADDFANEIREQAWIENDHLAELLEFLGVDNAGQRPWFTSAEDVARYAAAIARRMGLDQRQLSAVAIAGQLRDVGMAQIPERIVEKPGPLSEEERRQLQQHPLSSAEILKRVPSFEPALPLIASHHERFDGSGYPRGIRADEIPLGARILAVVDAYISMVSPRPYRPAMSLDEAVQEIRSGTGTQFDPVVVELFLQMVPRPSRN